MYFSGSVNSYHESAIQRALSPFRPKTMMNYRRQTHLFICFSIRTGATVTLSVGNLISFLEFLVANKVSPQVVSNYLSGIKSNLSLYLQPVEWMEHPMVTNYMKALYISVNSVPREKSVISLRDFLNMSYVLQQFDLPHVYRAAFALSFFGFLRISNLVAPTQQAFDHTRQLTRSDVSFTPTLKTQMTNY